MSVSDSRQAFLLVASRNQIVQDDITAQPNVVRSLIRDGRNIVALDFDSSTERVYWSDTSQDRIWSAHKNGSDRVVVRGVCKQLCMRCNFAVSFLTKNESLMGRYSTAE